MSVIIKEQQQRRGMNMPLVKIKRFAQVTIPPEARKKFNLSEGDYLDVETVEEGILLKPVSVIEKNKAWDRLLSVSNRVKDTKSHKRSEKAEEEEIAQIIKEFRKEEAKKKKRNA